MKIQRGTQRVSVSVISLFLSANCSCCFQKAEFPCTSLQPFSHIGWSSSFLLRKNYEGIPNPTQGPQSVQRRMIHHAAQMCLNCCSSQAPASSFIDLPLCPLEQLDFCMVPCRHANITLMQEIFNLQQQVLSDGFYLYVHTSRQSYFCGAILLNPSSHAAHLYHGVPWRPLKTFFESCFQVMILTLLSFS